jgi:hypothetical protein
LPPKKECGLHFLLQFKSQPSSCQMFDLWLTTHHICFSLLNLEKKLAHNSYCHYLGTGNLQVPGTYSPTLACLWATPSQLEEVHRLKAQVLFHLEKRRVRTKKDFIYNRRRDHIWGQCVLCPWWANGFTPRNLRPLVTVSRMESLVSSAVTALTQPNPMWSLLFNSRCVHHASKVLSNVSVRTKGTRKKECGWLHGIHPWPWMSLSVEIMLKSVEC